MLYIHIPFCQKICPFCSFAVRKNRQSEHEKYLNLLASEMQLYQDKWSQVVRQNLSVYIGGGTPSSLNLKHVQRLLEKVNQFFDLSADVEVTFEMNPEDVQPEYVKGLRELGVNRFSLGVQSLCDDVLLKLGRCHHAKQSYESLEVLASSAANYSMDLMFGVPNQTRDQWHHDLKMIETFQPPHVSLYGLTIEPRTAFDKRQDYKQWIDEHESLCEQMYLDATDTLQQLQIENYEVSNFAKKGFESQANLLVWRGHPYLGLGLGSHSFFKKTRQANTRSLQIYQSKLDLKKFPIEFCEELSDKQRFNELLALGLRQRQGFGMTQTSEKIWNKWQNDYQPKIEQLCQLGYAHWQEGALVLTTKGLLLADAITVQIALE